MKVSVVIATYGEESWRDLALERAFPSAKDQGAHEIIVGHDDTLTIGPVRNVLAGKASGDWLCFLDADDELAPGYLDAMRRAYEREREPTLPDGLLLTPAVQYVRKGRTDRPVFLDRRIPLAQDNWLVVGTLVSRRMFDLVGGFGDYPHGFEDWSLWAKCEKAGARIVKVQEAIYRAYWNPRSKHHLGWRDKRWQVETHKRIAAELAAWTP